MEIENANLDYVNQNNSFTYILNGQEYQMQKYNLNKLMNGYFSCLIIGKRQSGKTTLIKNIVDVVNKNQTYNILFSEDKNTLDISDIIQKQSVPDAKPLLLIIDDCNIYNLHYNIAFTSFFTNLHHYKISIIIATQNPKGLKVEERVNITHIFAFKENNISDLKRLYECFFGFIPNFKIFNYLNKKMNMYQCLVAENFFNDNRYKDYWFETCIIMDNVNDVDAMDIEQNKEENKEENTNLKDIIDKIKKNNKLIKILNKQNEKLHLMLDKFM